MIVVKYENHCCDCAVPAYPCIESSCPLTNVKVLYCDKCGEEAQRLYIHPDSGKELCRDCILDELEVIE